MVRQCLCLVFPLPSRPRHRLFASRLPRFERAAAAGHPHAQCWLGVCYATGRGCGQDAIAAAQCYQKAAESDHPRALANLGVCYMHGRGVPLSVGLAVDCWRRAAELEDPAGAFE